MAEKRISRVQALFKSSRCKGAVCLFGHYVCIGSEESTQAKVKKCGAINKERETYLGHNVSYFCLSARVCRCQIFHGRVDVIVAWEGNTYVSRRREKR